MDSKQGNIGTTLPGNVLLPDEPYDPGPEYGKKITKERWFEFGSVIVLIVVGTAFVMWRNYSAAPTPTTLDQAMAAMLSADYDPAGSEAVLGLEFRTYRKSLGPLICAVDLVGPAEREPFEMAVIQLIPKPGEWNPGEAELQRVVDEAAAIGARLVPTSGAALEKAVNALAPVNGVPRPHFKGVAASSDSWKVTWITYREYDEKSENIPAVYLILQRFEFGEDDANGDFNRALYTALNDGVDIRTRLSRESPE